MPNGFRNLILADGLHCIVDHNGRRRLEYGHIALRRNAGRSQRCGNCRTAFRNGQNLARHRIHCCSIRIRGCKHDRLVEEGFVADGIIQRKRFAHREIEILPIQIQRAVYDGQRNARGLFIGRRRRNLTGSLGNRSHNAVFIDGGNRFIGARKRNLGNHILWQLNARLGAVADRDYGFTQRKLDGRRFRINFNGNFLGHFADGRRQFAHSGTDRHDESVRINACRIGIERSIDNFAARIFGQHNRKLRRIADIQSGCGNAQLKIIRQSKYGHGKFRVQFAEHQSDLGLSVTYRAYQTVGIDRNHIFVGGDICNSVLQAFGQIDSNHRRFAFIQHICDGCVQRSNFINPDFASVSGHDGTVLDQRRGDRANALIQRGNISVFVQRNHIFRINAVNNFAFCTFGNHAGDRLTLANEHMPGFDHEINSCAPGLLLIGRIIFRRDHRRFEKNTFSQRFALYFNCRRANRNSRDDAAGIHNRDIFIFGSEYDFIGIFIAEDRNDFVGLVHLNCCKLLLQRKQNGCRFHGVFGFLQRCRLRQHHCGLLKNLGIILILGRKRSITGRRLLGLRLVSFHFYFELGQRIIGIIPIVYRLLDIAAEIIRFRFRQRLDELRIHPALHSLLFAEKNDLHSIGTAFLAAFGHQNNALCKNRCKSGIFFSERFKQSRLSDNPGIAETELLRLLGRHNFDCRFRLLRFGCNLNFLRRRRLRFQIEFIRNLGNRFFLRRAVRGIGFGFRILDDGNQRIRFSFRKHRLKITQHRCAQQTKTHQNRQPTFKFLHGLLHHLSLPQAA